MRRISFYSEVMRMLPIVLSLVGVFAAIAIFSFELRESRMWFPLMLGVSSSAVGAFLAYALIRLRMAISAPTVFISYTSADVEIARKLAKALSDIPVRVLFDRDEIRVGENLQQRIDELVDDADFICFVISKTSQQSKWASHELKHALERNKTILPAVLDHESVPTELADVVYADFTKEFDRGIRELQKSFRS